MAKRDQKQELLDAVRHPIRRSLLRRFLESTEMLRPKELSDLENESLSVISYHVRELDKLGATAMKFGTSTSRPASGFPPSATRARQRMEDPAERRVLELLRDDAPKVAPRKRPDANWVRRTGRALRSLREERGLIRQQLADRSTTADFIGQIEEGKCSDPGLRMLEELCRALKGEGSELAAQIEPVRADREAAVQTALDELTERDARLAEE